MQIPVASITKKNTTVLTCGVPRGAAVSRERGHAVAQTRGSINNKPEALPGRSGSPLFNEAGTKFVGLVAWRTGDGHGLAMNAAWVRAFVRGEVSKAESELPDDAIPLWQSRVRLVLVTSHGCQPCELQKQSMPDDVRYESVDIENVIAKGYNVSVTPTLMVFVDNQLKHTASGLLRSDRLQAFLARWGFSNRNEEDQPDDADLSDDLNPWSNPRR
ncbi:thioredoxin family protein [Rhodopirellula halodulae]|uniref:thioredoxin family protein n=1 Tax=Rhodopirellula halodulae TaxID=2894198 RepID=UPI001E32F210|nr:thioredoxin family protein [Rhodopirellula sp. JC737]MCC9654904.1 thioredoxin family protein [Rhodopirellula sp. JC737]